jgi:hypothetical protein
MKLSKAYKEFGIDTRKGSINFNLLQEPKYSKNDIAKYNTLEIGNLQADLQFWNDNAGYKYLLVVVDIVSKNIDFEAIKNKEPNSIISGFETILNRDYIFEHNKQTIVYPRSITVDDGGEFKGEFIKWCTDNEISLRTGRAGRKKQTSIVETYNYYISKLLAIKTTLQQAKDKTKNKVSQRQWVIHLPKLRTIMNDKEVKPKMINDFFTLKPISKNQLLNLGDKVYVILEKPKDVNDNQLTGNFRTGDYRFDKTPRRIEQRIYTLSNNPIRYVISGIKNATFARSELFLKN